MRRARINASERQDRIMFTDVAGGHLMPVRHAGRPLLSSTGAPWQDVLKLEQHRLPAREYPECCPREHVLSMHLGPVGTIEWRLAGERARRRVVFPGDLRLISRGVPTWSRSHRAADIFIALDPTFVASVANPSLPVERIAFTNL
jgi:AraC family transcriptional regulator